MSTDKLKGKDKRDFDREGKRKKARKLKAIALAEK